MADSEPLDETLSALADPTRRQVVELLRSGPLRASEIAERSGTSRPAMSRHLKIMLQSGLLRDERVPEDARLRLFHLRPEAFDDLGDWVDGVRAFWTDQLASFKKHAEGGRGTS